MSRVLVTGATGLIGRPVVAELGKRGHEVHAVSSSATEAPLGARELHRADLLAPRVAAELVARVRPSCLVHLAWKVVPPDYLRSAENLRWVEASLRLLTELPTVGGKRAVMAGTCFEYDLSGGVCREDATPLAPSTLYGASKAGLGTISVAAGAELGVDVAWARIFYPYGPGEHEARLVPAVIRNLLAGAEAPISHGRQRRDYVYSADVASALCDLVESDFMGTVNVGSGEAVEVRTIVDHIARRLGRPELVRYGALRAREGDMPLVEADIGRITEELGWKPSVPLDEGLERCIEWWKGVSE